MTEQWVTMKAAAQKLNVTANKISRWASKGLLQTKPNQCDGRSRLVNLFELQEKLAALEALQGLESR